MKKMTERSCTSSLRINQTGVSVTERSVVRKENLFLMLEPSHPVYCRFTGCGGNCGLLPPFQLRNLTTLFGSSPLWLGPRRDAKQQHLAHGPDAIGQSRGHGRRAPVPPFGRARSLRWLKVCQRHASAGMRQAE